MEKPREGGCQCGQLRYELVGEPIATAACHCRDCQKQSGSASSLSMVVRRDTFRWLAGQAASFQTHADSGTKNCVFCATCSSRIYNELGTMPKTFNLKPGTLDDTSWIEPSIHVWLQQKQPCVVVPASSRCFETNPA